MNADRIRNQKVESENRTLTIAFSAYPICRVQMGCRNAG